MLLKPSKRLLVLILLVELIAAYALRWPLTTASVKTAVEFQLAHTVITTENWHREGALNRHFIPSRSIDQDLPEWSERDTYYRDYLSLPPLAYMLLYWASLVAPGVEPVLLGKLFAQFLIGVTVLAAAALLFEVFGFWPVLLGLSFMVWTLPFLVWFINGYLGTTPALLFELLLIAWCLVLLKRRADPTAERPLSRLNWRHFAVAGVLAYLGGLSEWVAFLGNAIPVAAFTIIALALYRKDRAQARDAFFLAVWIAVCNAASFLTTFVLFGSKIGYAFYLRGFLGRVQYRTSTNEIVQEGSHTRLIFHQMETAWPRAMIFILVAMALVVLVWSLRSIRKDGIRWNVNSGAFHILGVGLALGPSFIYHYGLKNLVAIHYWFTGTWTLGWVMVICSFVYLLRDQIERLAGVARAPHVYAAVSSLLLIAIIGWNLAFVNLPAWMRELRDAGTIETFRTLGAELPNDGIPLIAAMPGMSYARYPYATAYLRRPVVEYREGGKFFLLGTDEEANRPLLRRGGPAYVVYDPTALKCAGDPVAIGKWSEDVPLAVCRVSIDKVVRRAWYVFAEVPVTPESLAMQFDARLKSASTDPASMLDLSRQMYQKLYVSSGPLVQALRERRPDLFSRIAKAWQAATRGVPSRTDVKFGSASILGFVERADHWYAIIDNTQNDPLPDYHDGVTVLANYKRADIITPFQVRTKDGTTPLPLIVIEMKPAEGVPRTGLRLELFDFSARLLLTQDAVIVSATGS